MYGQASDSISHCSAARGAKTTTRDEQRNGTGRLRIARPREKQVPERVHERGREGEQEGRGGHRR